MCVCSRVNFNASSFPFERVLPLGSVAALGVTEVPCRDGLWDDQLKPHFLLRPWLRAAGFEAVSGVSSKDSHPPDCARWLSVWAGWSKPKVSTALSPSGNVVPLLPRDTRAAWMACSLPLPKQRLQVFRDEL